VLSFHAFNLQYILRGKRIKGKVKMFLPFILYPKTD